MLDLTICSPTIWVNAFIKTYLLCRYFSAERKAEWLGNDNRKTMIKVKTIGQMLPFKSGTALPSPSQAPG
jgi:hypothetical protein